MNRFLDAKVGDYMTCEVVTVGPDVPVSDLERMLAASSFDGVPVVEHGRLVGIVTRLDLLKVFVFTPEHIVPAYEHLALTPARRIMHTDVRTFTPDSPLTRVLQRLVDTRVRSFPVVERGRVVGMIAREDIVRALSDLHDDPW